MNIFLNVLQEGHLGNKEPHKTALSVLSQQVSQSAQEKNCFQVTTSSNTYVETYRNSPIDDECQTQSAKMRKGSSKQFKQHTTATHVWI